MEEIEEFMPDFDEWLKNYKEPERRFGAAFDADTGQLISVGPYASIEMEYSKNIAEVEEDLAIKIINGEIHINNCFFDTSEGKFEITEEKTLTKIDDVLHRVIDKRYLDEEVKPDIYLTYNKGGSKLTVELSEEYGGTKVLDDQWQPATPRNVFWQGDTTLSFTIADYNDPHFPQKTFDVTLDELTGNSVTVDDVDITGKFSVFTRRLFKNYVLEEI